MGERVDYAIVQDGEPAILVECKRLGHWLQYDYITHFKCAYSD